MKKLLALVLTLTVALSGLTFAGGACCGYADTEGKKATTVPGYTAPGQTHP